MRRHHRSSFPSIDKAFSLSRDGLILMHVSRVYSYVRTLLPIFTRSSPARLLIHTHTHTHTHMHIQYAGFLRTRTLSQRSRDPKQTAQPGERRPVFSVGVRCPPRRIVGCLPSLQTNFVATRFAGSVWCMRVREVCLLVFPEKPYWVIEIQFIDPLMPMTLVAHAGITR